MTNGEIDRLLVEMIVEDSQQAAENEYEFPDSIEVHLRAYEYERRWELNSPIGWHGDGTTGATYAASLSADDSVNNPVALAALAASGPSLRGL